MKLFKTGFFLLTFLGLVVFVRPKLVDAWQWNLTGIHLIKGERVYLDVENPDCSHIWMVAYYAGRSGNDAGQYRTWEKALACSPSSLPILKVILLEDVDLAREAVRIYPKNYLAWFWLGDTLSPSDPSAAKQAYLQSVSLSPYYALAWCRLGSFYRKEENYKEALDAFTNCCYDGDPGSNGCYGAGKVLEILGDPQRAIKFYRRSHWEVALNRAKELAKELEQ